jgi:clan AA aspartic protease (TIGR02281 family)
VRGLAVSAEVESTAMRREDGSYAYRVRVDGPIGRGVVALTDASGTQLVGAISSEGGEAGAYVAVDAGALQSLAASDTPTLTLAEFSRRFFTERAEGRLIRFEHAIAAGDWTTAIALGVELRNLGWTYSDAVSDPLSKAYLHAALASDTQPADALALLDEAAGVLGENAERLQARAELLSELGDSVGALQAMRAAARSDPSLRPTLRRQVLAVASNGMLPEDDRIAVLETALADDPGHAPYAAALGRLYYADGRYVEATASLESAISQDAALAGDLGYLLATARQRLRTPGETIAPLHSSASGMYVYASVDGRAMRFVLDTGASYTALSAQAARALGLGYANGPQVALSTANGIVNAPLIRVNTIDVNGAVVQQIPVVVLDSTAPFDGLLGMSFLDHFDVAIDRSGNRIRLTRR